MPFLLIFAASSWVCCPQTSTWWILVVCLHRSIAVAVWGSDLCRFLRWVVFAGCVACRLSTWTWRFVLGCSVQNAPTSRSVLLPGVSSIHGDVSSACSGLYCLKRRSHGMCTQRAFCCCALGILSEGHLHGRARRRSGCCFEIVQGVACAEKTPR